MEVVIRHPLARKLLYRRALQEPVEFLLVQTPLQLHELTVLQQLVLRVRHRLLALHQQRDQQPLLQPVLRVRQPLARPVPIAAVAHVVPVRIRAAVHAVPLRMEAARAAAVRTAEVRIAVLHREAVIPQEDTPVVVLAEEVSPVAEEAEVAGADLASADKKKGGQQPPFFFYL